MAYKALKLKNMLIGRKYDVAVASGDGTIDYQGWDGWHTGGQRIVILNGDGVQEVSYKLLASKHYLILDNQNSRLKLNTNDFLVIGVLQ